MNTGLSVILKTDTLFIPKDLQETILKILDCFMVNH